MFHDFSREFVLRAVDDELPAPSCAQVVEDSVQLVLSGYAGHPEGDYDPPRSAGRFVFFHPV
jgi:hypothetical protein